MNPIVIILIVVAVIAVAVVALFVVGKISASRKKISPSIAKRFAKPQSQNAGKIEEKTSIFDKKNKQNSAKTPEKSKNAVSKDDKNNLEQKAESEEASKTESAKNDDVVIDFAETSKAQPVVQTFDEFDEVDKDFFKTDPQPSPQQEQPEVKRKSFEEIMRAREQRNAQEFEARSLAETQFDDDDFEKFRAEHSVYSKYFKDQSLIEEIQDMSPKMRAILFANLFKSKSDDQN